MNVYFFNFLKIEDILRVWMPWSRYCYWQITALLLFMSFYNPIVYINRDVNGYGSTLTISEAWNLRKKNKCIFSWYTLMFNKLFHATLPTIDFFQLPGSGCNLISCSHVSLATERVGVALSADKTLAMWLTKHLFLKPNIDFGTKFDFGTIQVNFILSNLQLWDPSD